MTAQSLPVKERHKLTFSPQTELTRFFVPADAPLHDNFELHCLTTIHDANVGGQDFLATWAMEIDNKWYFTCSVRKYTKFLPPEQSQHGKNSTGQHTAVLNTELMTLLLNITFVVFHD